MKNKILINLFLIKLALLLSKSSKREQYIKILIEKTEVYLAQFDKKEVNRLIRQINCLDENLSEKMFSENFLIYNILKFGKISLEVDNYNFKEFQTFKKYNDILKITLSIIDFEKSLK